MLTNFVMEEQPRGEGDNFPKMTVTSHFTLCTGIVLCTFIHPTHLRLSLEESVILNVPSIEGKKGKRPPPLPPEFTVRVSAEQAELGRISKALSVFRVERTLEVVQIGLCGHLCWGKLRHRGDK